MAINKLYKFRRIEEVAYFLNGAVLGTNAGAGVGGLVGKTLVFLLPTPVTVTFVVAASATPPGTNQNPYTLLYKDIKAQIEAALPAVIVLLTAENQQLLIVEVAPNTGVTIDGVASTAATPLGFDKAGPTVGRVYTPAVISVAPPCWTWAGEDQSGMHTVFTWE